MKKERKYYDAYFTVEASLIVPMVFLLVIMLIFWGFVCYEKTVSVQSCYLAALRSSNEWELSGKRLENYTEGELNRLLEEKRLFPIGDKKSIDIGFAKIKVELVGKMDLFFVKTRNGNGTKWEITGKKEAIRIKPSSYIRKNQLLRK